jgi:decaprenylphospho-beta-D-erythro-pentofuranosid-2-ulose 2-reductase
MAKHKREWSGERPGALVVGASSGIGAALARELAARDYSLALMARRGDALDALRSDLQSRAGGAAAAPSVYCYATDVRDADGAPALFERIRRDLGTSGSELRLVVYAAGVMPRATTSGGWRFDDERAMIETNITGAVRWLDLAAEAFTRVGAGTIVGISSVAGDRGRKGNSVYMASKAALSTYLESLRYRMAGTGVRVVTVKPGFVATPMTADHRTPRPLTISPEVAARRIADLCESGPSVAYVPSYWRAIMAAVRAVPPALMPRLPI